MKIKLLCSRAGADFAQNAGDEIEVSAEEGARMIEAGQAIPYAEAKIERAVKPAAKVEKRA
jgi:hypothetical protein